MLEVSRGISASFLDRSTNDTKRMVLIAFWRFRDEEWWICENLRAHQLMFCAGLTPGCAQHFRWCSRQGAPTSHHKSPQILGSCRYHNPSKPVQYSSNTIHVPRNNRKQVLLVLDVLDVQQGLFKAVPLSWKTDSRPKGLCTVEGLVRIQDVSTKDGFGAQFARDDWSFCQLHVRDGPWFWLFWHDRLML